MLVTTLEGGLAMASKTVKAPKRGLIKQHGRPQSRPVPKVSAGRGKTGAPSK